MGFAIIDFWKPSSGKPQVGLPSGKMTVQIAFIQSLPFGFSGDPSKLIDLTRA
jgi:hypothetical protein